MLLMNILLKKVINTPATEWKIIRTSIADVLICVP